MDRRGLKTSAMWRPFLNVPGATPGGGHQIKQGGFTMNCKELTVNDRPYSFDSPFDIYSKEFMDHLLAQVYRKIQGKTVCPMKCDCDRCGGRPAGCEYEIYP